MVKKLQDLFKFLVESPIDFVIIGGFAAVLHGCNQTTRDIDICLVLSSEHIQLLRDALKSINPKHRKSNQKQSFLTYPEDTTQIVNLHLETDLGVLDVVSHIEGVGNYYDVLKNAKEIPLYGKHCYVISIDDLIKSKKSLGRHRDLVIVEELEAIKNCSDNKL